MPPPTPKVSTSWLTVILLLKREKSLQSRPHWACRLPAFSAFVQGISTYKVSATYAATLNGAISRFMTHGRTTILVSFYWVYSCIHILPSIMYEARGLSSPLGTAVAHTHTSNRYPSFLMQRKKKKRKDNTNARCQVPSICVPFDHRKWSRGQCAICYGQYRPMIADALVWYSPPYVMGKE